MRFEFENKDGHTLVGSLEMPIGEAKSFALFAHCFTCTKNVFAANSISRKLRDLGIAVLRFDFTGLGNSEGDFANSNFSSNVDDLKSAYKALEEKYRAPELLIGHSLGGAAVLQAACDLEQVKALATIGAPSDAEHVVNLFKNHMIEIEKDGLAHVELAGRPFTIKKQFLDDLQESNVLEHLSKSKKALLVLHSPVDNTVSVDHAAKIFQSAKHPKSFISLDDASHLLDKKSDAEYAAKLIADWAEKYLTDHRVELPKLAEHQVFVRADKYRKLTNEVFTREHKLIADEPKKYGGSDLGPNPYELLLSALGACTSMTLKMYAAKKKIALESVEVELSHEKVHAADCEHCDKNVKKLDYIKKKIRITGELSHEQRQRMYEIAEKCPVNKTLKSGIHIERVE